MRKDSKFNIDKISLVGLNVLKAAITNDQEIESAPASEFKRFFNHSFIFSVDKPNNRTKVKYEINLTAENKSDSSQKVTGFFEIAYTFEVENLVEVIFDKDDIIEIDSNLVVAMANIAYSTTRGIIYQRCLGTVFNNILIPIIPTYKFESLFVENAKATTE